MLDICMNVETVERKVIMTVKKKNQKENKLFPLLALFFFHKLVTLKSGQGRYLKWKDFDFTLSNKTHKTPAFRFLSVHYLLLNAQSTVSVITRQLYQVS